MAEEITDTHVEEEPQADKPKKRAPTTGKFTNTSRDNVFTSKGRIAPGQSMQLSVKEAEQHGGKLEKV
jgi:hypothetical protein